LRPGEGPFLMAVRKRALMGTTRDFVVSSLGGGGEAERKGDGVCWRRKGGGGGDADSRGGCQGGGGDNALLEKEPEVPAAGVN
jgi:hypothetical protein